MVHHHDAVGHGERLLLVVRHHDGGDAERALQRLDLVAQPQAHTGIERRQGLVEQQQAGRGSKRAGQGHALLLAARELRRIARPCVRQANQGQKLGDALGDGGPRLTAAHQAVADIVSHREVGKERVGLEDDAEVALGRRQARDVPALLLDRAGGLRIKAGDGTQQGGLAAARRPQEADELALRDIERDVAEGGDVAEALVEVTDLQIAHFLGADLPS